MLTMTIIIIGVANFTIEMLEELMSKAEIPPAMNQVRVYQNNNFDSIKKV